MADEGHDEERADRRSRGASFLQSALRRVSLEFNSRPSSPSKTSPFKERTSLTKEKNSPVKGKTDPVKEEDPSPIVARGPWAGIDLYKFINIPEDAIPMKAFLTQYSGIPAEDTAAHLVRMQARLWAVYPNACVSQFRFAFLGFTDDLFYRGMLSQLLTAKLHSRAEMRLLDVGCCVGQVLRKIAADGVDSSWLYGADIEPRFQELGYELFNDRNKFKAKFVVGDVLTRDSTDKRLDVLDGKMTFVHASSFFHMFTWDDQLRAAMRMIRFLDPKAPSAMIFGRQAATLRPNAHQIGANHAYLHSPETWQKLWDEVGERTGTKWDATMILTGSFQMFGPESALRKASFCVQQI
ncbi:hypothetical protein F4861DRAFT_42471 [Xylaria intraflava]|nr:hypothetical protein F4861DRAFT_42471 [Xylaria intraflava]